MAISEAMAEKAIICYTLMAETAKDEKIDGELYSIFEGSLLEIFNKVSNSRSQYSKLFTGLEECGAIAVIRKGNALGPSRVALLAEPNVKILTEGLTFGRRGTRVQSTEQRLKDIQQQLGGINVPLAIAQLDERVRELQKQVNNINTIKESN